MTIEFVWHSMDILGKLDVILLAVMLVNALLISIDRFYYYARASRQTCVFVCNAGRLLRDGRFADILSTAGKAHRSSVAVVLKSGLTAFASTPLQLPDREAVAIAERASERARDIEAAKLKRGLSALRTIVGAAPFVGLLGTCAEILNAFRGIGMEKASGMAMTASSIATALATTAMSLVVAIPAAWCHNYFHGHVERVVGEMDYAAAETVTCLSMHGEARTQLRRSAEVESADSRTDALSAISWEVPYDHHRVVLGATGLCALYFLWLMWSGVDWWSDWRELFSSPPQTVVQYRGAYPPFAYTVISTRLPFVFPGAERSAKNLGTSSPDSYKVVHTYPHDPNAFTQGLIYLDSRFYESTGLYGRSSLRMADPATGKVLQKYDLPAAYFGEGLTDWGSNLIQLTWKEEKAFVYDRFSFSLVKTFSYKGEGWGLTHDRTHLIMSDGTSYLRFLDPKTFAEVRRIRVTDLDGKAVEDLDELEYVHGEIYANIWFSNTIVRISPRTGKVLGKIDLSGIIDKRELTNADAVLNGIAYDAARDRLFVTGKLWPKLFEIRLAPRETHRPVVRNRE